MSCECRPPIRRPSKACLEMVAQAQLGQERRHLYTNQDWPGTLECPPTARSSGRSEYRYFPIQHPKDGLSLPLPRALKEKFPYRYRALILRICFIPRGGFLLPLKSRVPYFLRPQGSCIPTSTKAQVRSGSRVPVQDRITPTHRVSISSRRKRRCSRTVHARGSGIVTRSVERREIRQKAARNVVLAVSRVEGKKIVCFLE